MESLEDIYRLVGKNVKKYRLEKGLSIKELSEKSHVSEKYLMKIENCEAKKLILTKSISIADAMNIYVRELFSE